jgi:hypothetical protein
VHLQNKTYAVLIAPSKTHTRIKKEGFKMKLKRKLVSIVLAGVMAFSTFAMVASACTNNPATCLRGGHFLPQNWPNPEIHTVPGIPSNAYHFRTDIRTSRIDVRNGESGLRRCPHGATIVDRFAIFGGRVLSTNRQVSFAVERFDGRNWVQESNTKTAMGAPAGSSFLTSSNVLHNGVQYHFRPVMANHILVSGGTVTIAQMYVQ